MGKGGSVLGLRMEDLRVAERRVFIADGKGGHQRLVPVSTRFFNAGAAYLDAERPAGLDTGHVFVVLNGPNRGKPLSAKGLDEVLLGARRRDGSGGTFEIGPLTARIWQVDHASGAPALALQAHLGEARFGYSGDTAWTDTLPAAAQGSDVFACEAYTYQKPVRYHLDLADLRAHAHEMATGRLILTHLGPSMLARLDDIEYETAADGLTLHT
jgi:Beta-lactamase superfamily domain